MIPVADKRATPSNSLKRRSQGPLLCPLYFALIPLLQCSNYLYYSIARYLCEKQVSTSAAVPFPMPVEASHEMPRVWATHEAAKAAVHAPNCTVPFFATHLQHLTTGWCEEGVTCDSRQAPPRTTGHGAAMPASLTSPEPHPPKACWVAEPALAWHAHWLFT